MNRIKAKQDGFSLINLPPIKTTNFTVEVFSRLGLIFSGKEERGTEFLTIAPLVSPFSSPESQGSFDSTGIPTNCITSFLPWEYFCEGVEFQNDKTRQTDEKCIHSVFDVCSLVYDGDVEGRIK